MLAALLNSARARPVRSGVTALSLTMLFAAGLAPTASAAPQAATNCGGQINRTPTPDEPNTVTYSFICDQDIFAYSLIVNRTIRDTELIDNFSTTANVFYSPTEYGPVPTIVPDESFACEGSIPGAGFNCASQSKTPGARTRHKVVGTFSTADPICGGKPTDAAKNSTVILPPAWVQLIVSDTSLANNGPFRLGVVPKCPKIRPKPKPKPHPHIKVCSKKGATPSCTPPKVKGNGKVQHGGHAQDQGQ